MVAKRIIKNTALNSIGRFWLILVNFFLTPLILSHLGDHKFALWALFWTFSTWAAFSDLGIGVSLVKEVAHLHVENDHREMNVTLCSTLFFNLSASFLVLVVTWLAADGLVDWMHVNPELRNDALSIAFLGPIVFMLLASQTIFDCFLRGFQRYDLINFVLIIVSILNVAGVWLALHYGYGISGLLVAAIVVYCIQLLLLAMFARRVFPDLMIRLRYVNFAKLTQIIPFGFRLQIGRLAELASYQSDKVILAVLTPLYFVTTYDIGSKVASLLRQIPYLLTSAIFPAVAQLQMEKDNERLWLMYERGSKYLWMVSTPLFLGLCLTAHLILQLWLGYVSPDVYFAVIILSAGYWWFVNVSMVTSVGTGMGWSKPVMYLSLVQAIANVTLSWILAHFIGYTGVLYATMITLIATSSALYLKFCYDFNRSVKHDSYLFMRVLLANIPPASLSFFYLYMGGYWHFTVVTRIDAIAPLLICIAIYCIVYCVSIRLMRLLDGIDMEWLGRFCPLWMRRCLSCEV